MPVSESKSRLRTEIVSQLRGLPPEQRAALSSALLERLLALPILSETVGGTLLAFAALPNEPNLALLAGKTPGLTLALPRVVAPGHLTIHRVPGFSSLVPSRMRVAEPDPALHPEVPLESIDLILVPGLAFSSRTGHRLGRGGGYYDRFLSRPELNRARRIGVCFDLQVLPSVPFDSHDCQVHVIVTDARALFINGFSGEGIRAT